MISETVVELSRAQFALNAGQYFLFAQLTLGLSVLLLGMESWFVLSGQAIYRQMTQFWGKLFAISFGLSVASSLVIVCQFGSYGSYFAHYVGDVFALPVLLGLAGLFLAANAMGWFWFGWQRLHKIAHLFITVLLCIGCHVSLFGLLMASGWMQNPLGAELNAQTLRMELVDLSLVLGNPLGLAKFLHSVLAAYVMAAGLVLAISAHYLLKQREMPLARLSYRCAAVLGLLAVAAAIGIGDAGIYGAGVMQRNKLAAVNGLSNDDLVEQNRQRIENGKHAYALLQELRDEKKDPPLLAAFAAAKADLGYALLLKRWQDNVADASAAQVDKAARASLPASAPLLWGYKLMMGAGGLLLALFLAASAAAVFGWPQPWLLKVSLYALPLPWLASAGGWVVSEFGRQPWLVAEVLPVWQGVSTLTTSDLIVSLIAFGAVYIGLLALAVLLALKFIAQGGASVWPMAGEPDHVV